jgi:hypothetical protein
MKKTFITLALLSIIGFSNVSAQTNVSGGIFSNTTWTLANSPYIVTDTVVVFPGVTLTIEPGVVVKFDNNIRLEIRQAIIIAQGTSADSIIFTSNAASPSPGIWDAVFLNGGTLYSKFNYCHFKYANGGIIGANKDTLTITNSNFDYNKYGFDVDSAHITITNSNFNNNNFGLNSNYGRYIRVDSCNFLNDSAGLSIYSPSAGFMSNCNISHNIYGANVITGCHVANCNFSYNQESGIYGVGGCIVTNCTFSFNKYGIGSMIPDDNDNLPSSCFSLINNCNISNNKYGIISLSDTIRNTKIDSNSAIGILTIEDSLTNCQIKYDSIGVQINWMILSVWGGGPSPIEIYNNIIEYNNIGIQDFGDCNGSIIGNTTQYCGVGIENNTDPFIITKNIIENDSIGIILSNTNSQVSCNDICSNNAYNLEITFSNNTNIAEGNFWCTTDSASIAAKIYDGHDNIDLGLVNFMPLDTIACSIITGIPELKHPIENNIQIYPNPVTDNLQIHTTLQIKSIDVLDITGRLLYTTTAKIIDCNGLSGGVYFIKASTEKGVVVKKFIKE